MGAASLWFGTTIGTLFKTKEKRDVTFNLIYVRLNKVINWKLENSKMQVITKEVIAIIRLYSNTFQNIRFASMFNEAWSGIEWEHGNYHSKIALAITECLTTPKLACISNSVSALMSRVCRVTLLIHGQGEKDQVDLNRHDVQTGRVNEDWMIDEKLGLEQDSTVGDADRFL